MAWIAGDPRKSTVLTVRVSDATIDALRRLAAEQRRTVSDVVRLLLEAAVGPRPDGERHDAGTIR